MFDGLQDRLQGVFRRLKGEGRVSREVLDGALREIRMALLEADVNYRVVKDFVAKIGAEAEGQGVIESLTPAQQVVKIVHSEMTALLGEKGEPLQVKGRPAVIVLCGLQGSGKTTTAGKLARHLRSQGKNPVLVAADLQRAAAVEQLQQVGRSVDTPVLTPDDSRQDVAGFVTSSLKQARELGRDVAIVDTAGRLHIDEELMAQLKAVVSQASPQEVLFVADAMTGQDAVRSGEAFSTALPITGIILTKLDGDTRGGAALSVRAVTGLPIRMVGVGEKLEDLEEFHPDRMASRILGMGDVLSLIEKAEKGVDAAESRRLAERLAKREFTLEDLRDQLRQMRRMGPLSQLMAALPRGGPLKGFDPSSVDESKLKRVEAIIDSMTPPERRKPTALNASRKRRIARGSGTTVQEINQLVKQYRMMQKMFKGVKGSWLRKAMGGG
ncbi:MAG: signal recognition particle protein [bacterium]|nr:signal recognition particle protein [bacterium]